MFFTEMGRCYCLKVYQIPEGTGFGALYFTEHVLKTAGKDIKGCTVALSGFGNVAWGAALKATELSKP